MVNGLPVKIKIMKEYKYLEKILSYLFYGFLICAILVPEEYRLLDIHLIIVGDFLIVPFNEYTIGLTLSLIIKDLKK